MSQSAGHRQQRSDDSYAQDVLRLHDGQTEEQMSGELREAAKMVGVDMNALAQQEQEPKPQQQAARPLSSDLPRRSQESFASKASQSTGLVSNFSDLSREVHQHNGGGRSRASLSFRDYDTFLARGKPDGRHTMSFPSPPATPSQSILSLPLSSPESSPKRPFRRIRGLSMLKLTRGNFSSSSLNDSCPHCPQDTLSQRRAVHKLPCGHRLCTQALRNTIKAATESEKGAVPSCCGRPVPGQLVEHVMSQAEQTALLEKLEQWDEAVSINPAASDPRISLASRRPGTLSPDSRTISDESKVDSVPPKQNENLDLVMEHSDFKQLRQEQAEQRDRFLVWIEKQRAELEAHHEHLRQEIKTRHETSTEELLDAHNGATADAEDKQVKAEADMRQAHTKEARDTATALRHMEAYCAGTYSTGVPHNRTVTEQDRAELDKARRTRDQMNNKHDSAINVLRGEQNRRMKYRAQRQEREVQDLRKAQREEEIEVERTFSEEMHQLDDGVAEKRHSLCVRWRIQTAIMVKKVEREGGVAVHGRLPSVEWQGGTLLSTVQPGATQCECVENSKHGISNGFAMRGRGL